MSKKNANGNSKGAIVAYILCIILFAGLAFVLLIGYSDYLFNGAKDFYEMVEDGHSPVTGEHVSISVDAVIDWYAETEHKINGFIPAGSEQHCVVWLDNNAFISMTIKGKKNIAKVDEIIEATNAYLDYADGYGEEAYLPKPVVFEGEITAIGSEVRKYYDEAMDILGVSDADDFTVYYLTIDTTSNKVRLWMMIGFFIAIDIVFIVMLVVTSKKNKMIKQAEAQLSNAPNQGMGMDAFGNANNMYGSGDFNNTYGQTNNDNNNNGSPYV